MRQTPGLDRWMTAYEPMLVKAAEGGHVGWPVEQAATVAGKMRAAFASGSYGHTGSWGIKQTCKVLGIPYTRKAIEAFLATEVQ